tara:strand:+ start:695 stop:1573 length:879 start_codon:yes stop_codon:yes gene_type:complete
MENIIEMRDADRPPAENAGLATEQPLMQTEEVPTENTVGVNETVTQEATQESSSRDDSTRFEYWQSQADKAKGELGTIRKELDYYKNSLAPVEQMIRNNPDVLDRLEHSPSNGQSQAYPNGLQKNSLQEPSAPERPHSYNEVDAYNDPESDSFKFRLAKEEYRDNYLGYLKDKDQVRERELQAQYQAQMQQQQTHMMQTQAHSHAVNAYGYDVNKANEFVQWAQNPDNLTMDNLAKLFELRTNANPVVQQRTQEMQNQAERLAVPKTAAVQTGKAEQPRSEEQLFNDAFFGK